MRKGKYIFRQGDTDDYSFYLLEGEVEMEVDGQVRNIIKGGTDSARYPLAQLQPRQFSARARTPLKVLQVNRNALDKLLVLGQQQGASGGGIEVDEAAQVEVDVIDAQDEATDWMTRMLQSELFSRLPTSNIQRLFTALEPVEFKAGDVVVQQGEPGDYYYIIQEGRCEVLRKPHPNAQDVKLAELKTGDDFGEEALLTGATRNATVRMLTDGVLVRLTKDDFIELVKNPALKAVTYDEAKPEVQKGAVWLDVRLKEEYDKGHFKDSVLLPLGMLRLKLGTLDKGRHYIVYCDTGGRSSVGAFLLTERGFDASYLRGGLVACAGAELEGADRAPPVPAAKPVTPPPAPSPPAKPAARPAEKAIDPDVRALAYRAELARTEIKMEMLERSKPEFAADDQRAWQGTEQRLREERARLEEAKRCAEEEAARKRQGEEERIRRLKEETERKLQAEKKKLETIYSRNAKELEKLEQMKREAEEQIRREREKLEAEAAEAKRRLSEADDIKKQLQEAREALEKEAERRRQEQAEKEKRIQEMAKRKIEEERRRMAEQFQKSNEALEQAQREKAAAEAARQAAAQEAERIIAEFKDQYARLRAEEEARLKAEREKLEREAQKIRDTLEEVRKTKDEAERARRAAEAQAMRLRAKLVRAGAKRDEELIAQVKAAEAEVSQAARELEQAEEKQKQMEAREVVVRDLAEMSEEEKAVRAQIEAELAEWLSEQELQQPDPEELKRQAEQMRRIKERADEAKRKTQEATQSLLDEISSQLGND